MSNARYVALGLSLLSLLAASTVEAGHRHRRCCCAATSCCATAAPTCCSADAASTAAPAGSTYQSYSYEPENSVAPAAPVPSGYVVAAPSESQAFYNHIRGDRKSLGRY